MMKRYMKILCLCLVVLFSLQQAVLAAEPTTVSLDVTGLESAHNYANNTDKSWSISYPGAESITMSFSSSTALESNYDYLYIKSEDGSFDQKYTGTVLAGKTVTVYDDAVTLRLTSDGSQTKWGFKIIDAYATIPVDPDCVITVMEPEHGTLSLSEASGFFGDIIEITAKPDPGYVLSGIYVDGEEVTGSFEITKETHTVSAEFELLYPDKTLVTSGSCGSDLAWMIYEDGTLYIAGTGPMANYSASNAAPWKDFVPFVTELVLDSGMTSIGNYAFANFDSLTEIEIPDTVTSIGANAFSACSALTEVTLSSEVQSIGASAFYECSSLTGIEIPDTVNSIGNSAFYGCDSLAAVTLGSSVKSIGASAFCGCSALAEIEIPATVTVIGNSAFEDCSALAEVAILSSEITFDGAIFADCPLLTSAGDIDSSTAIRFAWTDRIFEKSLYGCNFVTTVTIPDTITSIGSGAFQGCSALTEIEIPASVRTINSSAFKDCTGLTEIVVPDSVYYISDGAFNGCSGLTAITLPFLGGTPDAEYPYRLGEFFGTSSYSGATDVYQQNGSYYIPSSLRAVTITGECNLSGAFYGCSMLTRVTLSDSITTIGDSAFYGCSALTEIEIPDSVTTIDDSAFYGCSALAGIEIPASVTAIGDSAFRDCDALTGIQISDTVTSIGNSVCYDCDALATVTLGSGVGSIGSSFFYNCDALTGIQIPSSVTAIGNSAFYDCDALTGVQIPDTVTSIGDSAFYNCDALAAVALGSGVESIGSSVFYNCDALTEIEISDSVTTIGKSAFCDCDALTGIQIPTSVTTIGSEAFYSCSALTAIEIPGSVTSIGDSAFAYCNRLGRVTLPASATSFGKNVFSGCPLLTSAGPVGGNFSICYSWTNTIPAYAFYGCNNMNVVTIPKSVKSVGNFAFYDCSGLETVYYAASEIYWVTITIGSNNDALTNAQRVCIDNVEDVLTLSVSPVEHGALILSHAACTAGTTVTVSATPDPGYKLSAIYVDGVAIEGNTFTATKNHVVTAEFTFYSTVVASGTCGSDLDWCLYENGELAIIGSGSMTNYSSSSSSRAPWYPYCSQITRVTVENGVSTIGNCAFYDCAALTEIKIPNSVTTIGDSVFYDCAALTGIEIPNSVTAIGNYAFYGCDALTRIEIPNSVTSIGSYTFQNCDALTGIEIPNSVTSIGSSAFYNCDALTGIEIPNSVTSIGSFAFYDCDGLTEIEIPNSVTTIGSSAFENCSALTRIVIPASVTTIDSDAFYSCSALKTVFHIGTEETWNSITIGSWNSSLTNAQRYYITSVEDILTLTASPAEHGSISLSTEACAVGAAITVASIPEPGYKLSVVYVDGVAMEGNTFTATKNHVVTAEFAFYSPAVASGTCGSGLAWCLYENGELAITGSGSMSNYSSSSGSRAPWHSYRSQITRVTVENGVSTIGKYAFYQCAVTEVVIPASVTTINTYAFSGCSNLKQVFYIGTEETWDGIAIDSYNTALTNATRYYITSVEDILRCTVGNTKNGSLTLDPVTCIAGVTVTVNTRSEPGYKLSAIYVDGVAIEGNTFTATKNHVVTAEFAFYSPAVASGTCGSDLVWCLHENGELAIAGSGSMKDYDYWDHDQPWYAYRSQITRVTIGSGVTTIGDYAFYDCDALTEIVIPNSVTTIGSSAFEDCTALTEIVIPASVTSIGYEAFYGCSALATAEFLGNAPGSIDSEAFPSSSAGRFVISYHAGKTGWTSPTWNGYYTQCIDTQESEFSALNAEMRNAQGILFTLNEDSMTATVGDNSTTDNNSGYYGNNNGSVVIPAVVTKDGKSYRVIGVGQDAFRGNKALKKIELGSNVTSVDSTAFIDCPTLESFSVAAGSTHYSAVDGILFDMVGYYLYRYPSGKTGDQYSVPATVKTVGQYAFHGSKLTELTVPETVQTIGAGAFEDSKQLRSITLPFIGGSKDTESDFDYVFGGKAPQNLVSAVITGGKLNSGAFDSCSYLQSITLPAEDTVIPYNCFYNCAALKQLLFTDTLEASADLPEGRVILPKRITEIGSYAFYGCSSLKFVDLPDALKTISNWAFYKCSGLTRVEIPAEVTSIGSRAFDLCTSVTEFSVAAGNSKYCSDKWGVLYNKDMSSLIAYPANRQWPYYNIAEGTKTISSYAFNTCANLVNLYIPNSVTTLESYCITNCPGMTICAYSDSAAYSYAGKQSLDAWPMDNYTLQGIEIYALPEKTAYRMGEEDFTGLYMVANCGGRELQLDEYTVSYDQNRSGVQTVTVSFAGHTASFQILLYNGSTERLADFGELNLEAGTTGYVVVYDTLGKMLQIDSAQTIGGQLVLAVPKTTSADCVKLFLMNGNTFTPIAAPVQPLIVP